jgi:murein DD-endopeptidase MepM/ murein hydrolase activator NlpD
MLLGALLGLPRAPQAGLWSADSVAAYGLDAQLGQLTATRERIERRSALRQALSGRARALSGEIGILSRRAEQARVRITEQRDAVRAQEQDLDRIVPRLMVRIAAIEQRRGQAARALADLASLSRRQELDPEVRARMRAIGPVLLALLRNRDAASAALSRQRDRAIDRQQRLATQMPMLRAAVEDLQNRQDNMLGQHRSALQKLAAVDAELRHLSRTSAALARRMVTIEVAHLARAEPNAARPAHDRASMGVADAAVRGRAAHSAGVAQVSEPGMARALMVAAVARPPATLSARLEPVLAVVQPSRAARLPAARYGGPVGAGRADGPMTTGARPVSMAMSIASLSSRVAPARLPPPTPIRPSADVTSVGLDDRGHETGITIAAVPGQPVAAPQDGRIVFAGAFKSYGLLLIIEHDSEYHTLLWGFSKLRVGVGDEVRGGEIIGVMDVVDGVPPHLGVEFRRKGRPVNPLPWLAGSSSKVRG